MPFKVKLADRWTMPRKRGGVIFYPGVPVEYETWDAIPELVREDHELTPDVWWTIDELGEASKPSKRREKKPKAAEPDEPSGDE